MSDVGLTQEEAVALADALEVEVVFGSPEELELMEELGLMESQADPALLSGMRKLWEAAQNRG